MTIFVQSCSCNWHIKRIQKKCDIKTKSDTVYVTIKDSIPAIVASGTIGLQSSDSLLSVKADSIFEKTNAGNKACDSIINSLKAQIRHLIKNRPIIPSERTIYTHGGFIKVWLGKNGFEFQVDIPKQIIERKVPVVINNTEYKQSSQWHHWLGWILFVVLLIAAFLFRKR